MYTEHQYNAYLCHHGTKGMKWGIRRYQNKDGSLTPAGKKRYDKLVKEATKLDKDHERFMRRAEKFKSRTGDAEIETRSKEPKHKTRNNHDDGSSTKVSSISKRNVRSLSDDMLNKSISRLRQEKEMKRLLDEVNHPARAAVKRSMSSVAQKSLEEVGKKLAVSGLEYAVDKTLLKGSGLKSKHVSSFSKDMRGRFDKKVNNEGKKKKNKNKEDD